MSDDLTAASLILPAETGVWYDADDSIPYLMTYRAKQCKTLDRADLARWTKAAVIR